MSIAPKTTYDTVNPRPKLTDTPANKGPKQYARPTLGKCFQCGQVGHLSNECPQRRALALVDEEGNYDPEEVIAVEEDTAYVE